MSYKQRESDRERYARSTYEHKPDNARNNSSNELIKFNYSDTDTFENEISEIYSYGEESDFYSNRNAFEESMEDCGLPLAWKHMTPEQQSRAINYLMTNLEVSCRATRIKSCRSLAYLIQGNFGECLTLEEQAKNSQENVYLLYEQGLFPIFIQQLLIEASLNPSESCQNLTANTSSQNLVDSAELRLILSILCTITETMYHAKSSQDQRILDLREQFTQELRFPLGEELLSVTLFQMLNRFCAGQASHYPVRKIVILLWKILLITLGCNEEYRKLKEAKRRDARLPPSPDDTMDIIEDMPPCISFLPEAQLRARAALIGRLGGNKRKVFKQCAFEELSSYAEKCLSQYRDSDVKEGGEINDSTEVGQDSPVNDNENNNDSEQDDDMTQNDQVDFSNVDRERRKQTELEIHEQITDAKDEEKEKAEDKGKNEDLDEGNSELDPEFAPYWKYHPYESQSPDEIEAETNAECATLEEKSPKESDVLKSILESLGGFENLDGPICDEQNPETYDEVPNRNSNNLKTGLLGGNQLVADKSDQKMQYKGLPWAPKVRRVDLVQHISNIRQKFLGYTLQNDLETTFGLPDPIVEGIHVLKKHLYTSLSEKQLEREEAIGKYPLTHGEIDRNYKDSPAEKLYTALLPQLPQYMISLLKILLAATTDCKAKTERTESINILCEVYQEPEELNLVQMIKSTSDASRQKEVIIKSVSAILFILLRHFKLNHVYQFEYVSQQLMFANCIPLVLKFLSQDIQEFLNSQANIPEIDFPACVVGEPSELTHEAIQMAFHQPFSWRNMFSCINMVRVLNKLTKWKYSRVMMLVVFKSTPTLVKALNIRCAMFQLYVLKLLKVQLKFLGRQWKKTNMRLISAIYQKVRHRLTDDWAYNYEGEARPWDFQAEEFSLQGDINKFHMRRYQEILNPGKKATPQASESDRLCSLDDFFDDDHDSVIADLSVISPQFERNYEKWLDSEVFQRNIDWDKLLTA